ncbi:hypothetical protein M8818_002789 [Zalaria obscura]|uniref:Uncharacterized protein n=1 Tax=Zalaria obscura TaxID=2024903 RepID=A0ACC3SHS9_9PEZI
MSTNRRSLSIAESEPPTPVSVSGAKSAFEKASKVPSRDVWVYVYENNEMRKMPMEVLLHKVGGKSPPEVAIPRKPGRLPIRLQGTEDGPETFVASVNISTELRLSRWLGHHKILYVAGALPS